MRIEHKIKRALLVSPRLFQGKNRLALHPLVGLGYIAESLQNSGIQVSVLDMNLGYDLADLKSKIAEFNPDLIGFTIMTLGYKKFYDMVTQIKSLYPHLKIVVGGAHLSAFGEKVLSECPAIDQGIILEGDLSMAQLCLGEDFDNIPGLIYRNNGKIVTNKFEHFIENLDTLPFPKYSAFELDKYPTRQLAISTSRGCPYNCIYCSVIATIGKRFRARSPKNIVDEIGYWYNQGYREIYIIDDNFTLLRRRLEEICGLLKEANFKGIHLKCPNGIRADRIDRELLKKMKDAGFNFIAFGVEASSNKVLKNLKKGEEIEIIERSIKDACELGFDVDLFFLIGSPGETRENVNSSFSMARKYPLRRAIFYNLIPLPATELLQWLSKKNYLLYSEEKIFNEASYYLNRPFFFTPELSVREREDALKSGQKVALEIRRKYIQRKLKGPLPFKKIFSLLYTLPFIDDFMVNNLFLVGFKEKIKKIVFK